MNDVKKVAKEAEKEQQAKPELTVWEGAMPESNGKSNFTAILTRKDAKGLEAFEGFTIARSEYPDRVRYEADCVRHLIGELAEKPWITDYDANKHSGYVAPTTQQAAKAETGSVPVELAQVQEQIKKGSGFWHTCSGCHESEDGHDNGSYPHSAILGCKLGMGCDECGGIGAVWDNTDYEAMYAEDRAPTTSTVSAPCSVCNGTRCVYGVAGDPPSECEACFDQEPEGAQAAPEDVLDALNAIATWPITDPHNTDAHEMKKIATAVLVATSTDQANADTGSDHE